MTFKWACAPVEPDAKYGQLVSNFFWAQLDSFASRTLFIDCESGRRWRGAQIKAASARIARNLIKRGLGPHSTCVIFYKHNDYIQLAALGLLFAGSSVCVGYDADPEHEHAHMLKSLLPAFVFVPRKLVAEMARLCQSIGELAPLAIVIMDDDDDDEPGALAEARATYGQLEEGAKPLRILGLHTDLLATAQGHEHGFQKEEEEEEEQEQESPRLPVQVEPDWPAFILLTSGSTGRPKPVGRSQRNSLYVAHSLQGAGARKLWPLDASSVLLGHLALDHGTGCFQLKQTLAQGLTCVLTNGWKLEQALELIQRHRITDLVLGSALVHNLLTSRQVSELTLRSPPPSAAGEANGPPLSSLRNLIAVGSPLASVAAAREFMARLPGCSIRQAFGMTECGFLCVVPRELATCERYLEDTRVVGCALPNVELKLLALAPNSDELGDDDDGGDNDDENNNDYQKRSRDSEILEPDQVGELYVRAPTVSPGYHGRAYASQSEALFMPDGFYKSGDLCSLTRDGLLRVHGRQSDVLCLHDGWKVLPNEIEQVLLEHPLVREAAVVGVRHPELATCHAPRAYVVPREGVSVVHDDVTVVWRASGPPEQQHNGHCKANGPNAKADWGPMECCGGDGGGGCQTLSSKQVFEFVARRLSEPKHLIGGIKFMRALPKISIGKVDKNSLRRMDGLA